MKLSYEEVPFRPVDKHAKDGMRISNFTITMSTNKVMNVTEAEKNEKGLKAMTSVLFGKEENILRMIKLYNWSTDENKLEEDTFEEPDASIITNTSVKVAAELGMMRRGSRLHLHVVMKIWHKKFIRLDPVAIKKMANEILEEQGYPFPINYVHISVRGMESADYIRAEEYKSED